MSGNLTSDLALPSARALHQLPRMFASILSDDDSAYSMHPPQTILLVEDELAVRSLLARVLRARGYIVVEARDGVDALERAAAHDGPFQLLLTDVMMPNLDGIALAERVRAAGLAEHIIFMTGYSEVPLHNVGAVTVLRKPFVPKTLTDAVRSVLKR